MANDVVLVVDDEPFIRDMLTDVLQNEGYTTLTASSGLEALEEFGKRHPNLVITDLVMAAMDGFELCRRIKEASDVPIIMITDFPQRMVKTLQRSVIVDAFMTKPVEPEELISKVDALLERSPQSN